MKAFKFVQFAMPKLMFIVIFICYLPVCILSWLYWDDEKDNTWIYFAGLPLTIVYVVAVLWLLFP